MLKYFIMMLVMASSCSAFAYEPTPQDRSRALQLAKNTRTAVLSAQKAFDRDPLDHYDERISQPLKAALKAWDAKGTPPDLVKDTHLGCKSAASNLLTLAGDVAERHQKPGAFQSSIKQHLAEDMEQCSASIQRPSKFYIEH